MKSRLDSHSTSGFGYCWLSKLITCLGPPGRRVVVVVVVIVGGGGGLVKMLPLMPS